MVFVCCLVLSSVIVGANREQEFTTTYWIVDSHHFIVIDMIWELPVGMYLFSSFSHLFNDSLPFNRNYFKVVFVLFFLCQLFILIKNSITIVPLRAFSGLALNLYCKGSWSTRKRINLPVLFRILMVATLPPPLSPKLKNIYKYSYS